jgi:hypothetical protein
VYMSVYNVKENKAPLTGVGLSQGVQLLNIGTEKSTHVAQETLKAGCGIGSAALRMTCGPLGKNSPAVSDTPVFSSVIDKNLRIQQQIETANTTPSQQGALKAKNRAFDLLLWDLFSKASPVSGNKEIIVTGAVLCDGTGDWGLMLNMCHHIQRKFPDRIVRLIVVSDTLHKDRLQAPPNVKVDLIYRGQNTKKPPTVPPEAFGEADVLQKVKDAGCIISGNINIDGLYDSVKEAFVTKGIALHEADFATNRDTLCAQKESMGLGKDALGLFTKSTKKTYAWQDLDNRELKRTLFNTDQPSQEDVDAYLSKHDPFLGYMSASKLWCEFIPEAIIHAQAHVNPSIDIYAPGKAGNSAEVLSDLGWPSIDEWLKRSGFDELGIGSVKMIRYQDGAQLEETYQLAGGGIKELRIINPGTLSSKDFKVLSFLSLPLVGCTGDNSLSIALSYGKIPYYEIRHKKELMRNLLVLAQKKFGDRSTFYNYLHLCASEQPTGDLASNPELIEQAKEFGKMIREQYSFNSMLQGMVNERLLHQADPLYAKTVERLRGDYLHTDMTIEQVEKALIQELSQHGLLA